MTQVDFEGVLHAPTPGRRLTKGTVNIHLIKREKDFEVKEIWPQRPD
jgi:hypothetical protein